MAVDTRAKRQSAHRVANPFARILPLADGTIDQGDRQHVAGFYSGILAAAAAALLAAHSQIADVIHRSEIASVLSRNEIGAVTHRNEIVDI